MALGPPIFRRSPRLIPELPNGSWEIPPPPAAPTPPAPLLAALQSVAASMVGALFSGLIMFAVMRSQPGGSRMWLYALISVPTMLISGLWNHYYQKSSFRQQAERRQERYSRLLVSSRAELEPLWRQQRDAMCQIDPTPAECLVRAQQRDARLWERSPADPDFLAVRVGLAATPFGIEIKVSKQMNPLEPDPLHTQAQQIADELGVVRGAPLRVVLAETGALGLVGPRAQVIGAGRALALQIATHHSPDEVKILGVYPAAEKEEWEWLRWLPHVWSEDRTSRFLACDREGAHRLLSDLYDLLNGRRSQALVHGDSKAPRPLPRLVLILADPALAERSAVLALLLREGPALGAAAVLLADRKENLPKECRTLVEVGVGTGHLITAGARYGLTEFVPDQADVAACDRAARVMAPLRLQKMASPDELPKIVTLLDLFGVTQVSELRVLAHWHSSEPHRSLAVPVGIRGGGEKLALDLHEDRHGPHGLLAGATGAGKSELLQTLIISLAAAYHPHDLVFILIDFKGGALAADFKNLPHLVGAISNLSQGNMATRALEAIRGELRRRQALLSEAGVGNIGAYRLALEQGQQRPPLPHLVLIIDEFAELKQQLPEFMRELISAVRVGRSLGVHLLLATQKPAGVVDEQIWGNTRFRICLRVERPEDSMEVLKRPEAAGLTGRGRAYCQVGNNELFEQFQVAYSGAPYTGNVTARRPVGEVAAIHLDGRRERLYPPGGEEAPRTALGKQLLAVVDHLAAVAAGAGIRRLAGPWKEPLPTRIALDQVRSPEGWNGSRWLPVQTWMMPTVGLVDDPLNQYQGPQRINLGRDGHLGVYGAPSSGKTTFLLTLALSLALGHSPQDLHMYVLDFGGRALTMLTPLPHVGGVLVSDEAERLHRLFWHLRREMEARKERLAAAGVTTLSAYRSATAELLPAIVLMLDNYTGLANLYPHMEDDLALVAREGGNLGLHLVVTAGSPSALRVRVATNVTGAVALSLSDRGEYSALGRTNIVPLATPGRGMAKGAPPLEFQTALPAPGESEADRSALLRQRLEEMDRAWSGIRPKAISVLPDVVPLSELIGPNGTARSDQWGAVPVGVEVQSLEPLRVDLAEGPHFLITGPSQSGKSTLLHTWILALAACLPAQQWQLYLVDFRAESLAPFQTLPQVRGFLRSDEALREALVGIAETLHRRRQQGDEACGRGAPKPEHTPVVIVLEDFEVLRDGLQAETKELLEQLIRRERGVGLHIFLAGAAGDLAASWDGWVKALRELQTGFLVGSSEHGYLQLFNLQLPVGEGGKALPEGQGFFAKRGRARPFKAATPSVAPGSLQWWIQTLLSRA